MLIGFQGFSDALENESGAAAADDGDGSVQRREGLYVSFEENDFSEDDTDSNLLLVGFDGPARVRRRPAGDSKDQLGHVATGR